MLERHKLARVMISRFLHKCYFSRRSERRAPSIPRALERNEKECSLSIPLRILHSLNYLNDGTGNPCAGHCKLEAFPAARINELTRSSLENFGPFAPIGSSNTKIVCQNTSLEEKKTNCREKSAFLIYMKIKLWIKVKQALMIFHKRSISTINSY